MTQQIPGDAEWGATSDDLDEIYSRKMFYGCSFDHARELFGKSPIERCEDLRFMPQKAFDFYVEAFADYVYELETPSLDDADAASCFLHVVGFRKAALASAKVRQAMQRIASNQDFFLAPREIYGDFSVRVSTLLAGV